jgi:hypothetical protein
MVTASRVTRGGLAHTSMVTRVSIVSPSLYKWCVPGGGAVDGLGNFIGFLEKEKEEGRGPDHVLLLVPRSSLHI